MKIEGKPVVNYIYFLGEKVTDEKIKAPTEVKVDQRFTQWISTNTPYRSISAYAKYVGYFTGYETNDGTIYVNGNGDDLRKNSEYVSFGGDILSFKDVVEYFPEDGLDEALNVIKNKDRNKNESLDNNNNIKNSIEVEVKSGINGDGFKIVVKDADGSIIEQEDFHYGYNASYSKDWADKDKPYVTDIINSYLSKYNLSKDDLILTKGKNVFKDKDISDEVITRFKTDYLSESKHLDTDYQKKIKMLKELKSTLEDNSMLTEGRNVKLDNLDNVLIQEDGTYLLMIDKGGIVFADEASLKDFIQDCTTIGIFDTDGVKDFITRFNVKDGSLRKALKDYIAELNSDDDGLSSDYYNNKKERENTKKLFGKKDINESFETNVPEKGKLTQLLKQFDESGKTSRRGPWSIAKGGYDLSFELYYENQPVAQGYSDGEITSDFDLSKFDIDKKSLLNIINSVFNSTINESFNDDYEKAWAYEVYRASDGELLATDGRLKSYEIAVKYAEETAQAYEEQGYGECSYDVFEDTDPTPMWNRKKTMYESKKLTEGHEQYDYKGFSIDLDDDQFHNIKRQGSGNIAVEIKIGDTVYATVNGYDAAEEWIDKNGQKILNEIEAEKKRKEEIEQKKNEKRQALRDMLSRINSTNDFYDYREDSDPGISKSVHLDEEHLCKLLQLGNGNYSTRDSKGIPITTEIKGIDLFANVWDEGDAGYELSYGLGAYADSSGDESLENAFDGDARVFIYRNTMTNNIEDINKWLDKFINNTDSIAKDLIDEEWRASGFENYDSIFESFNQEGSKLIPEDTSAAEDIRSDILHSISTTAKFSSIEDITADEKAFYSVTPIDGDTGRKIELIIGERYDNVEMIPYTEDWSEELYSYEGSDSIQVEIKIYL